MTPERIAQLRRHAKSGLSAGAVTELCDEVERLQREVDRLAAHHPGEVLSQGRVNERDAPMIPGTRDRSGYERQTRTPGIGTNEVDIHKMGTELDG